MSSQKKSKYFLSPSLVQHVGLGDNAVSEAVFSKFEVSKRPDRLSEAEKRKLLGKAPSPFNKNSQQVTQTKTFAHANDEDYSQAVSVDKDNRKSITESKDLGIKPRNKSQHTSALTMSFSDSSDSDVEIVSKNIAAKKKLVKGSTALKPKTRKESHPLDVTMLSSSDEDSDVEVIRKGSKGKLVRGKRNASRTLRKGASRVSDSSSSDGSDDDSDGNYKKSSSTGAKTLQRGGRRLLKGGGEPQKSTKSKRLQRGQVKNPVKRQRVSMDDDEDSAIVDSDSDALKEEEISGDDELDEIERRAEALMDAASSSDEEDSEDIEQDDDNNDQGVDSDASSGDESNEVQAMFDNCEAISKRLSKSVQDINLPEAALKSKSKNKNTKDDLVTREAADALFPEGYSLKEYQLVGLNWLRLLYSQNLNGILADEMGLGKTVQAIAILAWLKKTQDVRGPHLVVAPGSTLENWRREVQRWVPWARVEVYHGSQAARTGLAQRYERKARKNPEVDILITTYTYFERDSSGADRAFLSKFAYQYIIYDEAHGMKNMNSARYRRLVRLSSRRRLLLSGTPVQNNLQELLALMSFCMPKVFNASSDRLAEYFNDADNRGSTSIGRIRDAMRPFVLRRLKADVLGQLSPKTDDIRLIEMPDVQNKVYKDIIKSYRQKKEDAKNSKRGTRELDSVTTHFFSQLRKAANHPLLVRQYFGKSADESPDGVARSLDKVVDLLNRVKAFGPAATVRMIEKEIKNYSDWDFHLLALEYGSRNGELRGMILPQEALWTSAKARQLQTLLPQLKKDGHRFLIFSQWTTLLDLIEEMLNSMGMLFVRFDGQTAIHDRQTIVDKYNTDMSISACLLSTRAGGMGINLTSADTVILHDLDWSHATDRQAEDRCHRIGQTKPVTVIKLVTRDTVDENILQIQTRKKHLEAALLINSAGTSNSSQQTSSMSQDTDAELDAALAKDLDPISIIMNRL
mmetsp:Transcript_962/g.2268  ORF Transcript_962/g.2268 Transcript_962/m.2268 type:complete len:970 (+) Transcript_962:111-3020(+)